VSAEDTTKITSHHRPYVATVRHCLLPSRAPQLMMWMGKNVICTLIIIANFQNKSEFSNFFEFELNSSSGLFLNFNLKSITI
jgi:hypothetical protein